MTDSAHDEASDCGQAREADCPFCSSQTQAQAVEACGTVLAIRDAAPAAPGHLLVIPRRHAPDCFAMTPRELRDALRLLELLRDRALREDPKITGINVGTNCGASAGQKIMHAHIHFIPRRDSNHKGRGVKGVIRSKFAY